MVEKIEKYADAYHVDAQDLYDTLYCESGLNADAIGDKGDSRGIAQINRPAHPEITDAEAFDPDFSIDFAAREFGLGHQYLWSCWKRQHLQ